MQIRKKNCILLKQRIKIDILDYNSINIVQLYTLSYSVSQQRVIHLGAMGEGMDLNPVEDKNLAEIQMHIWKDFAINIDQQKLHRKTQICF